MRMRHAGLTFGLALLGVRRQITGARIGAVQRHLSGITGRCRHLLRTGGSRMLPRWIETVPMSECGRRMTPRPALPARIRRVDGRRQDNGNRRLTRPSLTSDPASPTVTRRGLPPSATDPGPRGLSHGDR